MPGLRRHDRLDARRQRRVAHGQRLVVGERAQLLLVGEAIAAGVERHHEVGLLDDLLAVQVEVGVVQQQRIAVGGRVREVPLGVVGEALGLHVDVEDPVVGHVHRLRRRAPRADLLVADAERRGLLGVVVGGVGRAEQVPAGHQVGVGVVVAERAVLVRPRHAGDPEAPLAVVVAERGPQPRGLDEQRQADLAREGGVLDRVLVAQHRVGDVGGDVHRRGARRPVARALAPGDRPPRERGAGQAELLGALAREVERRVAPAQRVARRLGVDVGQHGQHEGLGVPERVAVVARAGQALGRDRAALGAGAGLQHVEEPEAHRLLERGVAVDLDVGALPEAVEELALLAAEAVPAGVARLGQRAARLRAQRRQRARARPRVGHVLEHAQLAATRHVGGDDDAPRVLPRLGGRLRARRPVDLVVHRHAQPATAALQAMHERDAHLVVVGLLGLQRRGQRRRRARIGLLVVRLAVLVGHQLGLDHQPRAVAERLDLVVDRGGAALGQRDQARGGDPDLGAGRRAPVHAPAQDAGAEVEDPLVLEQLAVADVEELVVDVQAQELAVGDVDHRLARLGVAVGVLGVGQRPDLVQPVEVGAGQAVGLALVEVAAHPDVAVGQREDRLGLGEHVERQARLADRPGVDGVVGAVLDHGSSSARSWTTRVAPCAASASA